MDAHYRRLEAIYDSAPVNNHFLRPTLLVKDGSSTLTIQFDKTHFHAGGGIHGARYFRLMDDAAYFAAASQEKEFFLLTLSFEVKLFRMITTEELECIGTFEGKEGKDYIATAEIYANGKIAAKGKGVFRASEMRYNDIQS
ncbi:MAG: PaaI family thioesterase [Flavobacteriales bacterium]|nr:PaaI family thioesterase [Flavobacteriales bacterium]